MEQMSEESREAERKLHRQAFPEETQIESLETQLTIWKAKSSVQNELETAFRTHHHRAGHLLAALQTVLQTAHSPYFQSACENIREIAHAAIDADAAFLAQLDERLKKETP